MGDLVDKLVIDRQKVKAGFARYTGNYDVDNDKIKLKIEHTYRVADLCDKIAKDLGLSSYDVDMAWLIGMQLLANLSCLCCRLFYIGRARIRPAV